MANNIVGSEILTSSEATEVSFHIKPTATAFKILSEGLYSNKILAFVRELGCNARDAHVAANNLSTPFEVHIPNTFEPYFEIKDFGTGLSQEEIFGLYTTYFESTKCNNTNFIGEMGLGSKSPFAYTNQFSVSSRYNGKEYHFSAFIDENGMPAIALLNTTCTNEHNGLTVRIPVKPNDFIEVFDNVKKVFQRFDPKPVITGGTIIWNPPETVVMSGNGWRIYDNNWSRNYLRAIVGLVEYQTTGYQTNNRIEKYFLSSNMEIDFDYGDLSVTASREEISFDKATTIKFHNRLTQIQKEIVAQIEQMIYSQPTLWHAHIKRDELGSANVIFNVIAEHQLMCWRGQQIPNTFEYKISPKVKVDLFYIRNHNSKYFRKETINDKISTVAGNHIEIYYNELGDVYKAHVKNRVNQLTDKKYVYVIHKQADTTPREFKDELVRIMQKMGGYELKNLLDIELKTNLPKNAKSFASRENYIKVLCGVRKSRNNVFINKFAKRRNKGFFKNCLVPWYVPVHKHNVVIGQNQDGSLNLIPNIWHAFESLRGLGMTIPIDIVAIEHRKVKKVPKNWVNTLEKIQEYLMNEEIIRKISMLLQAEKIIKDYRDFIGYDDESVKYIKCKELEEATKIYQKANQIRKDHVHVYTFLPILNLLEQMGMPVKFDNTESQRLSSLLHQFKEKYPLLNVFNSYTIWKNIEAVNQYIEAIDLLEQTTKTHLQSHI